MSLRKKYKMPLYIRNDELFSSWLVRLAMHYGTTALTLGAFFWPKRRIWTMDVDNMSGTLDFSLLSKMTGNSEADIGRSFPAQCYDEVVTSDEVKEQLSHWLIRLGARNVKRHSGMPYCPVCFCDNSYAYIKRQWRMAWHTHCQDHQCLLRQDCPHCGAIFAPHRLPLGTLSMNHCYQCTFPLGDSAYNRRNESAYALQVLCISTITINEGFFNLLSLTAQAWLSQLYFLVNLTKSTIARNNGLFKLMLPFIRDIKITRELDDGLPIAQSNSIYRAYVMQHVYDVWQAHGQEMVVACIDNNVSINSINPDNVLLPAAIASAFKALQVNEQQRSGCSKSVNRVIQQPIPDAIVRKKWHRLQRKYLGRQ